MILLFSNFIVHNSNCSVNIKYFRKHGYLNSQTLKKTFGFRILNFLEIFGKKSSPARIMYLVIFVILQYCCLLGSNKYWKYLNIK